MQDRSSSYDFIDLDEEESLKLLQEPSFNAAFPKYSSFQPEPVRASQEDLSLFIRSTSPIAGQSEATIPNETNNSDNDHILLQSKDGKLLKLKYKAKGAFLEGRDSKVFRGSLQVGGHEIFDVAVKIYKDDENSFKGAKKEIELAKLTRIGCPEHFLRLFYSGPLTQENEFACIWEWIEGPSLDRFLLQNSGIVDEDFLIKSLAKAISFLHSNHQVHHDLKPQNILISKDAKRVVLIDFGDSMVVDEDSLCPLDLGIGLGTLAYTGPELLSRKVDFYDPFAADIYSFGVVLFVILNRKSKILPFAALIPHRAVQLILTVQKGFFAGGYNPESPLDSKFYPLMKSCLSVNPIERPSIQEILKTLGGS